MLSRTGQQSYRVEALDIESIVATTLATLRQSIETSGARISVGSLPMAVGDATAIGQVFSNLIDNAIKYLDPHRQGVIEIRGGREGAEAHYSVSDNGVGVPETVRVRLFQVFQRFHPDLASGDGIGLAAMKRIVERHNGRIWFESKGDSGSVFHFTLPLSSTTDVK
jgi:light-regulated signal transduction histidine kinase (bacteriophytochrome)